MDVNKDYRAVSLSPISSFNYIRTPATVRDSGPVRWPSDYTAGRESDVDFQSICDVLRCSPALNVKFQNYFQTE